MTPKILLVLWIALLVCALSNSAVAQDAAKAKIAVLELKLREKPDQFDWGLHNELRHLYGGLDAKKSCYHIDVILRHRPMDGYMLDILGARGADKDPAAAVSRLLDLAKKYPDFRFLTAAAHLKSAELTSDATQRKEFLKLVAAMKGEDLRRYRVLAATKLDADNRPVTQAPWTIPVLVINYFPLTADKKNIDIKVTSNVGAPLTEIEARCERQTRETIEALEQGSRFRPYRDAQAKTSLRYKLLDTITFHEPVPHHPTKKNYSDYNKIMERVKIDDWVENKGVREVWIWAYHSKEIGPVESNMSSIHGNVSNSGRDPLDLPLLRHTYTVYHYNYERGTDMAVHNHLHQIEAVMRQHGGELWQNFEGKPNAWRAGNCHFPVNGRRDYDYANKDYVETDIEDWKPEGFGQKQKMNCDRWSGNDLKWYVYWMQAIPGASNGLTFKDRKLSNWWEFIGDYDQAVQRSSKFTD